MRAVNTLSILTSIIRINNGQIADIFRCWSVSRQRSGRPIICLLEREKSHTATPSLLLSGLGPWLPGWSQAPLLFSDQNFWTFLARAGWLWDSRPTKCEKIYQSSQSEDQTKHWKYNTTDCADCHCSVLTLKNDPPSYSKAGIVSSQGNDQPVPVTDSNCSQIFTKCCFFSLP